jgi:hypothetical protein
MLRRCAAASLSELMILGLQVVMDIIKSVKG